MTDSGCDDIDTGVFQHFPVWFFFRFCFQFSCNIRMIVSAVAKEQAVIVVDKQSEENRNDSIIVISESSSDDDVVFVGELKSVDQSLKGDTSGEQSTFSGYSGDTSSSSSDFGTSPPDRTEYLRLLYAGKGALIPDVSMRPPPRNDATNEITTSTPKKNE